MPYWIFAPLSEFGSPFVNGGNQATLVCCNTTPRCSLCVQCPSKIDLLLFDGQDCPKMFPWGAGAPSRWHWMHTYLRTHKKSSHHQCTQNNSEGACGKMLHSTACCVCVWHPSIKIKSKLTEHIKKTTRKLNFTRNGISYSCCGLLFQFFMVCIAWIYGYTRIYTVLMKNMPP